MYIVWITINFGVQMFELFGSQLAFFNYLIKAVYIVFVHSYLITISFF